MERLVQLIPIRYGYQLDIEGLYFELQNWHMNLTDNSYKKFYDFLIEYEVLINSLCLAYDMKPFYFFGDECKPISTLKERFNFILKHNMFDINFFFRSKLYPYPVNPLNCEYSLDYIIAAYTYFYPIYDSFLQISMGKNPRLESLIDKLNHHIETVSKSDISDENQENKSDHLSPKDIMNAKIAAEQRIKVMPAMRWQVFQRDQWKCVSCGRTAKDKIILHIDHIVPRSKGGKDELENYQTLCNICNIGKSNKDDTNLRELHKHNEI